MALLPLSGRGKGRSAIVDDEYYPLLRRRRWHLNNSGYPQTTIIDEHDHKVMLHRFILSPPANLDVDHINGDKLDCRESNLRICTKSQNGRNRGRNSNNTSGYKGVLARDGRWIARVTTRGRQLHLGRFDSPEEAARAYNEAALKYHGEFAWVNPLPKREFGASDPTAQPIAAGQ